MNREYGLMALPTPRHLPLFIQTLKTDTAFLPVTLYLLPTLLPQSLMKTKRTIYKCFILKRGNRERRMKNEEWKTIFVFQPFSLSVFQVFNGYKRLFIIASFIFTLQYTPALAQHHVSGFVSDKLTGERLIGANIVETGATNGTSTDNNGYFSLITKDKSIQISFIGYKSSTVQFSSDTLAHILLEGGQELEEITVKGKQLKRFNVSTLSHQEMLNIPSLGGKPDVLKALQLLPGIQSQQEGSSLLNVRGGNPGENLYLIDNTPLIYVNHLGGFASVFNPDMINNIEVYKGGFPAKYGGKLSSIVAITQREGDKSKLKGSFGIGVTDASFSIEGPLLNNKASFIVTGRKTLIDLFMLAASGLIEGNEVFVMYGFHDMNGKFSWHPDEKNSFYLNVYQGDDYMNFWNKDRKKNKEKFSLTNSWGNWLVAARWNRVMSPRLFVDNTFSYTHYRLKVLSSYNSTSIIDTVNYSNEYYSSVRDLSLRSDWQYKLMKEWNLDFGAKATLYNHIPNKTTLSESTINTPFETINTSETSVYLNNRFTLFNVIDADAGARLVNYRSGSYNHLSIEPRLMVNARISPSQILNFTYQKVNQFAHLVFTSGSIMNNEIWIPADKNITPSNSTQFSLGWKGQFFNETIESEVNLYYKELNHLATYKEGYSNLMGDGGWRSKVETGGSGKAKGAEVLVRKLKGKWTGFLGYTFSNATRMFPGIIKGKEYLFDYDRPHSLSINLNRKINEKWSFNASWVYQTGLPYTPVVGRQLTPGTKTGENGEIEYSEAFIYGERNSARLKDYHRLDIGATLTTKTKHGRKAQWNFSVYNAYNRHNPAAYYYGYDKDGFVRYDHENYKPLNQYQISFFPIIPSVSYKVFFGENSSTIKYTTVNEPVFNTQKQDTSQAAGNFTEKRLTKNENSFKQKKSEKTNKENYTIKSRWNIRLGFAQYPKEYFDHVPKNFRAEINYGLLDFLEVGASLGYSQYNSMEQSTNSSGTNFLTIVNAPTTSYGLSSSVHLFPFILKKKDFWMDLYLTGKYGGYCILSKEGYYPKRKNNPDYGIYGGLALYPFEHLGLFAEYGYGNRTNLRFGLSIKF
jgi:hypothetical protein